jgi:hypothetical protein
MSEQRSPLADLFRRFPGLLHLADAYLNTSDYEDGSPEAAVDAFIADEPRLVESAWEGVRHVLTVVPDPEDMVAALRSAHFPYIPSDPDDARDFLMDVEQRLLLALRT